MRFSATHLSIVRIPTWYRFARSRRVSIESADKLSTLTLFAKRSAFLPTEIRVRFRSEEEERFSNNYELAPRSDLAFQATWGLVNHNFSSATKAP